jgi:hypothetical protein
MTLVNLIKYASAGFAMLCLPSLAFGQEYPTSHRIQISEPCPQIAKWLTQALAAGAHWRMLRYDRELGTLNFTVIDSGDLSKADIRQYLDDKKAKHVHIDEVHFTLRSLVSSTLSFDNAPHSTGESCTIAAAIMYVAKNGSVALSSGNGEAELLQRIQTRYAEHGLDY